MPAADNVIRRSVQDFTPDVVPLTTGRRALGREATRLSLVRDAANPEGFEELHARAGENLVRGFTAVYRCGKPVSADLTASRRAG
jgi:hypothetical protein